jgi:hypothetical protein
MSDCPGAKMATQVALIFILPEKDKVRGNGTRYLDHHKASSEPTGKTWTSAMLDIQMPTKAMHKANGVKRFMNDTSQGA